MTLWDRKPPKMPLSLLSIGHLLRSMSFLKSNLFPLLTQKPILPGKQVRCLQNFISPPVPPGLIPSTTAPWSHSQLCNWTPAAFSRSYWLHPQESQRPSPTFLHLTQPIIPASNSSRHCLVTHELSRPEKQVSQLKTLHLYVLSSKSNPPIPSPDLLKNIWRNLPSLPCDSMSCRCHRTSPPNLIPQPIALSQPPTQSGIPASPMANSDRETGGWQQIFTYPFAPPVPIF